MIKVKVRHIATNQVVIFVPGGSKKQNYLILIDLGGETRKARKPLHLGQLQGFLGLMDFVTDYSV